MDVETKRVHEMKAADLMSEVLVMLEEDTEAREAAQLFKRNRITGAPVVDGAGQVVGVLSVTDLMACETGANIEARKAAGHYHMSDLVATMPSVDELGVAKLDGLKVKDLMVTNFVSTSSRRSLSSVASLMLQNKIRRILIIDNRRLVGIITQTDILKAVARDV